MLLYKVWIWDLASPLSKRNQQKLFQMRWELSGLESRGMKFSSVRQYRVMVKSRDYGA